MGEKWIMGDVEGMEPWTQRKVRERERGRIGENERKREEHTVDCTRKTFPKPLIGKKKEVALCEFCNQWSSMTGLLEVRGVAGVELSGHCSAPVKKVVR